MSGVEGSALLRFPILVYCSGTGCWEYEEGKKDRFGRCSGCREYKACVEGSKAGSTGTLAEEAGAMFIEAA